jgi:hypothetical protein
VTSVTVTGSNGLSGSGTVTTSGTITLSNAGVRSTTINGNYLRVNTNGTNTDLTVPYATSAGNADTIDNLHAADLVKFYLSPLETNAPAASAKTWFTNTMPAKSGAIVYNVPGSEKTIIVGKSSGAYGHMLQLNYDDTYLRILRYAAGSWKSTDWEKISAGYADSAGSVAWSNVTGKPTIPTVGNGTVTIKQGGTSKGSFTMNQSGNTTIELTDNNTNYYHTRAYSSGLKISTGTGVSDMYVPTGTTSTLGVVKQHTAADCTSYTSDEGATTPAAVKKAISTFVSVSRSLTSGTKIGTITINGTATELYCQTNTNTDTNVTQTNTTGNSTYRVLLSGNANDTTETTTARKSAKLLFNTNSGKMDLSGSL